jgi:hypothetical protein
MSADEYLFWCSVSAAWAWGQAAVMWHGVYRENKGMAWYGAASFVAYSLVSAFCFGRML